MHQQLQHEVDHGALLFCRYRGVLTLVTIPVSPSLPAPEDCFDAVVACAGTICWCSAGKFQWPGADAQHQQTASRCTCSYRSVVYAQLPGKEGMLCDTLQLCKQLHHRGSLPVTVIVLSTQPKHHTTSAHAASTLCLAEMYKSQSRCHPSCCAGPAGGSHALPMFFSMPKDPEV